MKRTSANSFALSGRTDVLLGGSQSNSSQYSQTSEKGVPTLQGAHGSDNTVRLMKGWVATNHPEAQALFAKLPADAITKVSNRFAED